MSEMIEVATADLSGEALGWAVGKAEGLELYLVEPHYGNGWRVFSRKMGDVMEYTKRYNPWEDWAIGGELIRKHGCDLNCIAPENAWESYCWDDSSKTPWLHVAEGEDPLEAACRAIIRAKAGDKTLIPKELAA